MEPRERLLELLRRYGWNATSFQALEPEFQYWFWGSEAAVAYFDTGRAWVVAGAPVAPEEQLGDIARRFAAEAAKNGKRVVLFGVEERFLHAINLPALAVGEQPSWDPRRWTERHRGHRSLKEQLRRARAKGVVVERVDPAAIEAGPLRAAANRLIRRWLASRGMPAMTFLVELHPFLFATERRYYLARAAADVVGLLVAVPVYQRNGWFFEDILRDPCAPNGTAESLVNAAMLDVASDAADFVTLGLAPLSGDSRWLRNARTLMSGFYNFEGLHAFKSKLRPDAWDPIYIAWADGGNALTAMYDALDAFAGGAIVRFGVRAIFRAPSPVVLLLGLALIPWVGLMSSVETRRWFPSPFVQFAWVSFDVAMCGVLVSLSRRWRTRVALAACAAATADGVLTTIQAARYNVKRVRRASDVLVMCAAIAAPFAAAAILFGGLRRSVRSASSARGPAVSRTADTRRSVSASTTRAIHAAPSTM